MLIPAGADELCLDFANTRYWRGTAEPTETLTAYPDLLRWLAEHAVLPAGIADWMQDIPEQAAAIFAEILGVREAVYRVFSAVAGDEPAGEADLEELNRALAEAPPRRRLARAATGFVWETGLPARSTATLLAPVIWSAADLLAGAGRRRIRRCANEQCLWLFVDNSKIGTRRWCDMAACGNRAKARRHYLKTKRG